MASDFHTHHIKSSCRSLISASEPITDHTVSLEIHPWHLPCSFDPSFLPDSAKLCQFSALGEIGLDRLRGPGMPIQKEYFQKLLALASECRKPIVLHCVKAIDEIFSLLKPFKLRVMFHGFRSSPEMLDELWKRGFTVSLHRSTVNNVLLMRKLKYASGAFGFESDNDPSTEIANVIAKAEATAELTGLEAITDQYFNDFLEI